jgi:hypothetical protein
VAELIALVLVNRWPDCKHKGIDMVARELTRPSAWTRQRGFVGVAVAAALLVFVASAGTAFASRAIPWRSTSTERLSGATAVLPPAPGIWKSEKLGSGPGQGAEMTGTFTVAAAGYVTALHGTITSFAETSCGTGSIAVPGKLKIIHGTGEDSYGAYNLYAAGVINADADPIVQPERLVLLHKGKRVTGSVEVSFVWPPQKGTSTGAEINYGSCSLQLAFLHG